MKKLCSIILITCCVSSTTALFAKTIDNIKAIVNDDVITQHELNTKVLLAKQQLTQAGKPLPHNLSHQVLTKMIDTLLQLQLARKANYDISNVELDHTIKYIAKKNNLTLTQLQQALQHDGISLQDFRTQIHDQMLIERVQHQMLDHNITVTDQELKDVLKKPHNQTNLEYHLEDIIIQAPDNSTATELLKHLTPSNFAQIAAQHTNLQFVDLGWRTITKLPEAFVAVILKHQPPAILGPLMLENGTHILHLVATRGAIPLTKAQAQEIIYREKLAAKISSWLTELRTKAYIKIL